MSREDRSDEGSGGYADPLYLAAGDNPNMQISSMIFNGENFLNWSRSVKMSLGSKNKLGYIDGSTKRPEAGTKEFQRWMRNDYMVRSWLFKSMNDRLAESLILCESAKHLWDELVERYGVSNAPQIYQLKRELNKIEQGDLTVSEYYCKQKSLSDEICYLQGYPVCECEAKKSCVCNVERKIIEMQEKNKVIDFLMGLNVKKYQGVIGNIIAMDPLPNLSKAYHIVQQAEKQRMLQEGMEEFKEADLSAFNINRMKKGSQSFRESKAEKMKLKCEYCGKKGHVMKGCFELNGYPDWWKNPKGKATGKLAANVVKEENEDDPLSDTLDEGSSGTKGDKGIIDTVVQEVIKAMNIKQGGQGNSSTGGFAGTIILSNVSNLLNFFDKDAWIVDSGASDHIAGNKSLFDEITLLNKGIKVGLPDGSVKTIYHMGTVTLSDQIRLKKVLFMPDFKHNLLSLSKLLEGSNMNVIFHKNGCTFQDHSTRSVIGEGKKIGGLYKFQLPGKDGRLHDDVDTGCMMGAVLKADDEQNKRGL